jgi:hypothetical protein
MVSLHFASDFTALNLRLLECYLLAHLTLFTQRLMWAFSISPGSLGVVLDPTEFATILAVVEILRRAMWNLFRLENEQLTNCEHFRAINIPVPLPYALHNLI